MLSPNLLLSSRRAMAATLALLSGASALASNTGFAVGGTSLTDAGSDFTVLVQAASGPSFGTVTLINDALSFTPSAFTSGVLTGAAAGQLTGTITLLLTPTSANRLISGTMLNELGDYWLDNSGGTAHVIGASYQLIARNASGNITASQLIKNTNTANTQGPSALGVTGYGSNTAWGLSGSLAGSAGGWAPTAGSAVIVTIQNNLFWNLGAGNSGFIQKKDTGMTLNVQASTVPLPASGWLLMPALGLLAAVARRRR